MNSRFEQMAEILEDAQALRQARRNGAAKRDPDETTEDDVIIAILRHGSAWEALEKKHRLTSLLRTIKPMDP